MPLRRSLFLCICISALLLLCSGCADGTGKDNAPLLGLKWFAAYDDVKSALDAYELIAERENADQNVAQKMLDYASAELFGQTCDLTLCFTDSGLIGFNYHDTERHQSFREWFGTLENAYGLPTEEGSGIASWYDDPLGSNTAVYLFNLADGVQISIYATADSPDKSYEKARERSFPTPELRMPIVPVEKETKKREAAESVQTEAAEQAQNPVQPEHAANAAPEAPVTAAAAPENPDPAGETATTAVTGTTGQTDHPASTGTTAATEKTVTTTAAPKPRSQWSKAQARDFLLNGLQFYGSPNEEREKMRSFSQLWEYRIEEPGEPWELDMEYENVQYLKKDCDCVLCFTSLGLVGINYFDSNLSDYTDWQNALTDIYGTPADEQYDYCAWEVQQISGMTIYLFAFEDGIQISFYVSDAGSEISGS